MGSKSQSLCLQSAILGDAIGTDQQVDRLAHGDAEPAQGAVVIRGFERQVGTADRHHLGAEQNVPDDCVLTRIGDAAQDFAKDEIVAIGS
jgi:hypothetical protein